MPGSPGGWGARGPARLWAALLASACVALLPLFASACAAPLALEEGRFRLRDGVASIGDLASFDARWRPVDRDGALLRYEIPSQGRAAWLRQCRGASAAAGPEAHALLVRLDGARVVREGPVTLAGREGWLLVATASQDGRPVTLKSVTRVAADACVDDFLLVAFGDLSALESGFDRWWASFDSGTPG